MATITDVCNASVSDRVPRNTLANNKIGNQKVAIPTSTRTGDDPDATLTTSKTNPANAVVSNTLRKSCCTTSNTRIAPLIVASPGISMVIANARPAFSGRASNHAATDGINLCLCGLVPIGIWQQCQEPRTFHGGLQLPLVNRLGTRNATRKQVEILVIDLSNVFGRKTAILTPA
jgi:hypothetical protein